MSPNLSLIHIYGSVIVHVFSPEAREFYDLDHLWADGEDVPLDFVQE